MKTFLFTLLLMTSMMSCNKEELFVESVVEVVEEDTPDTDDTNTPDEPTAVDTSLPCDFTLNDIQANSTVVINCVLDLGGQTITLPENVTIVYEGGDIINGTINFSGGSTFDGNFLNATLTIGGSTPQLKDPVFNFDPSRWGIVEGETTSAIAQKNNDILESTMFMAKELGIKTLKIDKMDAYFEVSKVTSTTSNQNFYPSEEAINVPSDFTLEMTENTHLRVQPNGNNDYVLLAIRDESNVTIEGGNLYGDRAKHDDSNKVGNSGHVIQIHGSNNVKINGVTTVDGTGDGININSLGFTFEAGYIPANNIEVTNCILDNNRRNNISITDGFNMLIDGNTFLNAGVDHPNDPGVAPGFALDVEAVRGGSFETGYLLYEKAYDITISNNTENGSKYGAFIVAIGQDVTIKNNTTEGGIAIADGSGVKILDNVITANPNDPTGAGITTGHPDSKSASNNVIAGNTISGYTVGIAVYTRDNEIYDNNIKEFVTGIQPKNIKNMNFYNNTFESTLSNSVGIFGNVTTMDNINIYENEFIRTGREGIKMVMVNNNAGEENNKVVINNNDFKNSKITLSRSKNMDFTNNTSEYISLINAESMILSGNTVNASSNHGIEILNGCNNVDIISNNITVTGNRQCTYQTSGLVNINVTNNSCN